jgi:hypothetical protein
VWRWQPQDSLRRQLWTSAGRSQSGRWRLSAPGRDCQFAVDADSSHSICMASNGRSSRWWAHHPDPSATFATPSSSPRSGRCCCPMVDESRKARPTFNVAGRFRTSKIPTAHLRLAIPSASMERSTTRHKAVQVSSATGVVTLEGRPWSDGQPPVLGLPHNSHLAYRWPTAPIAPCSASGAWPHLRSTGLRRPDHHLISAEPLGGV